MKSALPGEGVARPRVMVVMDFPEPEECKRGQVFSSVSGLFVRFVLQELMLHRDCYLTYAIKKAPGKRAKPLKKIQEKWGRVLRAEILSLRPSLVLCLGRTAQRVLCGACWSYGTSKVVPDVVLAYAVAHPAHILRRKNNAAALRVWEAQLASMKALLRGGRC